MFYTDNCCNDRAFWQSIFDSLKSKTLLDVYAREGVASFPGDIKCTDNVDTIEKCCEILSKRAEIGFDCEWECGLVGNYHFNFNTGFKAIIRSKLQEKGCYNPTVR